MSASSNEVLNFLVARQSVSALAEPGPSRAQWDSILRAACAVPDHGQLRPYRFVVVEGDGRAAFGDALGRTAMARRPDVPAGYFEKVRAKAFRSPSILVLVASPKPGKIEAWEQTATAACAGYAVVLAAEALGLGAVWKSVPFTRGPALSEALGLTDSEEMLGWIHLGSPANAISEPRPAFDPSAVTTLLDAQGRRAF